MYRASCRLQHFVTSTLAVRGSLPSSLLLRSLIVWGMKLWKYVSLLVTFVDIDSKGSWDCAEVWWWKEFWLDSLLITWQKFWIVYASVVHVCMSCACVVHELCVCCAHGLCTWVLRVCVTRVFCAHGRVLPACDACMCCARMLSVRVLCVWW